MIAAVETELIYEIMSTFGYTEEFPDGSPARVFWSKPDTALRRQAERVKEKCSLRTETTLQFPFISLWRVSIEADTVRWNQSLTRTGAPTSYTEGSTIHGKKIFPIILNIQMDHWCGKTVSSLETGICKYYFWKANTPEITVTDVNSVTVKVPMEFEDSTDNSALEEEFNTGIMYRMTYEMRLHTYCTEDADFTTVNTIRYNIYDDTAEGLADDSENAVTLINKDIDE